MWLRNRLMRPSRSPGVRYELYEQRGRQDGHSVKDWELAEREIRKDELHRRNLLEQNAKVLTHQQRK
jgi:hypothetical protein